MRNQTSVQGCNSLIDFVAIIGTFNYVLGAYSEQGVQLRTENYFFVGGGWEIVLHLRP